MQGGLGISGTEGYVLPQLGVSESFPEPSLRDLLLELGLGR